MKTKIIKFECTRFIRGRKILQSFTEVTNIGSILYFDSLCISLLISFADLVL